MLRVDPDIGTDSGYGGARKAGIAFDPGDHIFRQRRDFRLLSVADVHLHQRADAIGAIAADQDPMRVVQQDVFKAHRTVLGHGQAC
ncbi:hypothetical protein D3C72_2037870 [compost metagenome]